MKPEIKALRAALETPAFEKVRAALEAEAEECWHFSRRTPEDYWCNDRWQAAWRELVLSELAVGVAGINPVTLQPVFWAWEHGGEMPVAEITGDELADALRDWALKVTR